MAAAGSVSDLGERLRRIVDHAPTGMVVVDADGAITFANRAAERILRLRRSEIAERTYDDARWHIVALDGGPFAADDLPVARVLASREPVEDVRHAIEHPDGARTALSVNAAPIVDASGGLEGVAVTFNDITGSLRLHEAADRYARELERSNEELQQFAYVASHDLQEPLRMITGFLGLLQRRYGGQLDSDADDFINFAVDGAQRLQRMIEDLLLYSRVQTHGREFAPTSVRDALDAALSNLRSTIDETGATVDIGPLPIVPADGIQLITLFQNLIGNALKFCGPEPPEVRIEATQHPEHWVIRVTDHGIGIPADEHDRIFEIFQRLHTREEQPGTGIGLAVCRRIVERHGGRIWVASEPGGGATFSFSLPGAASAAAVSEGASDA